MAGYAGAHTHKGKEIGMSESSVERGDAEERAGAPLTETEIDSSEQPPSAESGRSASEADVEGGEAPT
jgi:hypothetical protein